MKWLLSMLFISSTALAHTGNDLHAWCTLKGMETACQFYVSGAVAGHVSTILLKSKTFDDVTRGKFFCAPDNVTVGQSVAIVTKWMNDNPERRHMDAAVVVFNAMEKAFPCASPPSR